MKKHEITVGGTFGIPQYLDNAAQLFEDTVSTITEAGYTYTAYEYQDDCGCVIVLRVQ